VHVVLTNACIGPNTIEQVRDAVNSLIHCWVVKGTGRFADLMAALCKNPNMDILNQEWFKETFGTDNETGNETALQKEIEKRHLDNPLRTREDIIAIYLADRRRMREDKVAMYLAICRHPRLHVFDLETDSFEELMADLETMRSA
jgi:hypothetical protein